MKKSNLYTATGDAGTTSLVGGKRESKASQRIDTYGTLDELNSHIGLLRAMMPDDDPTDAMLNTIQCKIFDIGTAIATPPEISTTDPVTQADIDTLEHNIDTIDSKLPPLSSFVLPTGTPASAQAHIARTVCRRAERLAVSLSQSAPVSPLSLVYLNRLSDFLFAIARFNNINASHPEIFWRKDC